MKQNQCDIVVLAFYFPERVELYIWDSQYGKAKVGKYTDVLGHSIIVPAKVSDMQSVEIFESPGEKIYSRFFSEWYEQINLYR